MSTIYLQQHHIASQLVAELSNKINTFNSPKNRIFVSDALS